MKGRLLTTVGTATTLAIGLMVGAPPASAAGCVTPREFAKARNGMSVTQVASLFGTKGRVTAKSSGYGMTIVIRDYTACTQFGAVSMLFENGRLTTKSAVF